MALIETSTWQPVTNEVWGWRLYGGPRFSPDSKRLLTFMEDKAIVVGTSNGERRGETGVHENNVSAIAANGTGTLVATGDASGNVHLWDAENLTETGRFSGHSDWINDAAFSRDGKLLVTSSQDRTVRVWSVSRPWAGRISA